MEEGENQTLDRHVLDELAASVNDDREFVAHLVETYLADSAEHVDSVEAAVDAGDAQALVRPAHTLKSSSATVGAARLATVARRLEAAGRSGEIDEEARSVASALRADWEAAVEELRAWMAGE